MHSKKKKFILPIAILEERTGRDSFENSVKNLIPEKKDVCIYLQIFAFSQGLQTC